MNNNTTLLLGAVAYDPKVVTIWDGFQRYFARQVSLSITSSSRITNARWSRTSPVTFTWPGIHRSRGYNASASPAPSAGAQKRSACAIRIAT